MYGEQK